MPLLSEHFCSAERLEVLFVQDLERLFGIAEAQNHDVRARLAFGRVSVHIVNLQIANNIEKVGEAAHFVGNGACDDVGHGGAEAGLGENFDRFLRFVHDEADEAEFAGVGKRERQEVNPCIGKGAANSLETTRTVLNEN